MLAKRLRDEAKRVWTWQLALESSPVNQAAKHTLLQPLPPQKVLRHKHRVETIEREVFCAKKIDQNGHYRSSPRTILLSIHYYTHLRYARNLASSPFRQQEILAWECFRGHSTSMHTARNYVAEGQEHFSYRNSPLEEYRWPDRDDPDAGRRPSSRKRS